MIGSWDQISWDQISWDQEANIDYISEMGNRRLWSNDTGARYTDSGQP